MIELRFKARVITKTSKASLYEVADRKIIWIPNQFKLKPLDDGIHEYEFPVNFQFTVTHGVLRQSWFFVGVELAEEFPDTIEVLNDE